MNTNLTAQKGVFGKQTRFFILITAFLLILFFTGKALLVREVALQVDGKNLVVSTLGGTVAEALEKAKIKIAKEDKVLPGLKVQVTDGLKIRVTRAVSLKIRTDDRELEVKTADAKVGQVLKKQGIDVKTEDIVVPGVDSPVTKGMVIAITKAVPVSIISDGKTVTLNSAKSTVANVLADAGIKLGPLDKIQPSLTTQIAANLKVKITRVATKEEQVEQAIPFEIIKRRDGNRPYGKSAVVQDGKNGMERLHYKVTLEDGKPVKKELVGKNVLRPAISKIIAMGTMRMVSRGGTEFRAADAMVMKTSAYTHTGHRTSTGVYPSHGVVAVDPSVIPLGTKLYIEGYGYARALDIGSDIKGNRIDLFFDSYGEAKRWGVQHRKVYIVK